MDKFSTEKSWIKKVVKVIVSQIEQDLDRYKMKDWDREKVSVIFLAWAPWCWKTEFILSILKKSKHFFLDIDSYRNYFTWYKGNNSEDFKKR